MTKAELGMLVIVIVFGGLLLGGLTMLRAGSLPPMTFWTAGVMGLMATFGLIAAWGLSSR